MRMRNLVSVSSLESFVLTLPSGQNARCDLLNFRDFFSNLPFLALKGNFSLFRDPFPVGLFLERHFLENPLN